MFSRKSRNDGTAGMMAAVGTLDIQKIEGKRPLTVDEIVHLSHPQAGLSDYVNNYRTRNLTNINRGLRKIKIAQDHGIASLMGLLDLTIVRGGGEQINLGIVSTRVVTTAGVTKVVDFLRASDTATGSTFKFHGLGTGVAAEAASDTALGTELTTQYVTDNTRPTGTQTNSGATVYQSVATITLDSGTPAVTEHGLFSASTAGTLLDRSVFAAVNLVGANGDAITSTYSLTVSAGG